MFYLVAYDIACNKRRRKVSELLEGYGRRVQYSVFECALTGGKYGELQRRLKPRINVEEDSLRFYPVSGHTLEQVEAWGAGPPITQKPSSMVF